MMINNLYLLYDINYNNIVLNISVVALFISLTALIYTVRTYLLKSGQKIKCNYTICIEWGDEESYISSLTLENFKDRATIIYSIYIKIGNNNYLEIENFKESPLILKPFEVYYIEYDPVLLYNNGIDRIKIGDFLQNSKVIRSIVLSTTEGKLNVKLNTKRWDPRIMFLKNYFTSIIRPQRLTYKHKAYGNNVKFLLILKHKNRTEQVIPIKENDDQVRLFEKFIFTEKSLSNVSQLEAYIRLQKEQDKLDFDYFEVLSLSEKIENIKKDYKNDKAIEIMGCFKYHLLGRLYTVKENRNLNKKNKMRQYGKNTHFKNQQL